MEPRPLRVVTPQLFPMVLSLISSVTVLAKTQNDFDPDAAYQRFKTFSFVAGIDLGKTGILDDPDTRFRIANFVSGILETRGLREIPRDQQYDLAVRVWIALLDRQSVSTISYPTATYWGGYDPFWYGPWGYWYEQTVVRNYLEGTLIIDLLNPADKQLVWRTYLKRDFKDRAKAYEQAKRELTKAFSEFPPSAKQAAAKRRERAEETGK